MNAISCPQCRTINALTSASCRNCSFPFTSIPSTAYVSVPAEQTYQAQNPAAANLSIPVDNEIGRKAHLWYRVYCGVLAVLYLCLAGLGIFLVVAQPASRDYSPQEILMMGIIYTILGLAFLVISLIALFLPRKSYNWIVGIVMMALGMTSCCFLPFLIPLLIYWLKPETKAYFGRNQ